MYCMRECTAYDYDFKTIIVFLKDEISFIGLPPMQDTCNRDQKQKEFFIDLRKANQKIKTILEITLQRKNSSGKNRKN
jgi:hypothetical protein